MEKYSYFTEDEIKCKCGCGTIIVDPLHFFRMNLLRQAMGVPLNPTSWCRCPIHNKNEGGADDSSHLIGEATDIWCPSLLFQHRLIFYAGAIGFCGIGIESDFLHLDNDLIKGSDRFWLY